MASIIDICNMALGSFGHSQTIASLEEGGVAASTLNRFYEPCRDAALAAANWNFATKRVKLATVDATVTNWGFVYAYPADCISPRRIVIPGMRNPRHDQKIPFEVANVSGSRVILTDQEQAELVYTVRVEDPNLFAPDFLMALVSMLAANVATPISGKPELARVALQNYMLQISMAAAQNLNEGQDDVAPECEFISVRN